MDSKKELKKFIFPAFLLIAGLGAAAVFLNLFIELAEDLLATEVQTFDTEVIQFIQSFQSPALDQAMAIITELASVWVLTILSTVTFLFLWVKNNDKVGAFFFIINVACGGLLTKLLKIYYARQRPSIIPEIDAIGFSFPSGHTMGALLYYGFVAYIVLRSSAIKAWKWGTAFFTLVLILLVSFSRIYLGAHYPSDVIAGHLAGAFWLILCILALELVKWRSTYSIRPWKSFRDFLRDRFK